MHGCFWFLPDFFDWPVSVIERVHDLDPGATFSGIVTAPAREIPRLQALNKPAIHPLHHIDVLQCEWLARPFDKGRLSAYENQLGTDTVNRIIIADRNIARGFVTNADLPESPLMRVTQTHESRMRYVVGLLDFLFGYFETQRPDYVFAPGVAGSLALALGEVSRYLGIPFRCLLWTRLGSRHTLTASPVGQSPEIEATFKSACLDADVVRGTIGEASSIIQDFRSKPATLQKTGGDARKALQPLGLIDLAALAWRALTQRPPELLNLPYPASHLTWEIRRRYRAQRLLKSKLFSPADALKEWRYVFFPLHLSPEASTMVLSPMLTDQIAVIEALAKSLPAEMILVVKEHTPMLGRRPAGFYERIAQFPRVVLVSPFETAIELIKHAELTCVITGSAAWEALVLQRPALCLGPAIYQMVGEGIMQCGELSRLPAAVKEALCLAPVSDERLVRYVASVLKESFEFPRNLRFGQSADTVKKHAKISDDIVTKLLQSLGAEVASGA